MSTARGVQHTGGYHEYTGGVQYTKGLSWLHWGIPRCMWGLL